MTGPYQHVQRTAELPVLSGRIELDCGEYTMAAAITGGRSVVELVEEFDDLITTFGFANPVRYINPRRRLRLEVDADMREMTVTVRRKGESGS